MDDSRTFANVMAARPVLLAPMEDVTDPVFRALCRARGAHACVTEFVLAEQLCSGDDRARHKLDLSTDTGPTAIQIYGADPEALIAAARLADAAGPAWIDVNCGCWVSRVVHRGAGAAWLRDPDAMVSMAARVVRSCVRPVTVKTRIGWGPEPLMPIVDLARRLEDAGVAGLTVHCRTALMGHEGRADWRWAARAQAAVSIPVIVNGDIASAGLARRALQETGCAGAMIGRRAIVHPWVFREARALLDTGEGVAPPTTQERVEACREHVDRALAYPYYDERAAVRRAMRFVRGYLRGVPGGVRTVEPEVQRLELACSAVEVASALEELQRTLLKSRNHQ